MNSGTLRMTGIAGLVWGVLAILVFLVTILFVARAVSSGQGAAAAGTGTGMIVQIFSLIAALALCWMLYQLSQVYGGGMGAIVCYATIALTILQVVLTFAGIAGIITIILFILQGVGLILVGVFGIMGKRLSSGSYKAFCVLMIVTGASIAVVVLAFLYPFLALATGIVLYVAMNGAAKQATA